MERPSSSCSSCGPWWRLPLMLGLVLAAILLARSRGVRQIESQPATTPAPPLRAELPDALSGETVALAIDFGNGHRQHFGKIAWRPGMTVYDLLRETPRSDLRLEVRGTGASAFLASLDGVTNEGAGGRNWTYTVNGQHADRSFAVYELQPGDQVLWSFATQR